MKEEQQIAIQKISPYIRYVNDMVFSDTHAQKDRILYDHEFIFALDGETLLDYGGEEYHLEKSDLFYMKPGVKNRMYAVPGKTFHANCVHFDWVWGDEQFEFTAEQVYMGRELTDGERSLIERLTKRPAYEVSDFNMPVVIRGLDYDIMAPLFKELYHCFCQSDLASRLRERAIFMQIIAELSAFQLTEHGVQKNHYHQKTISQAVQYMHANYKEELKTPTLAERFHLSDKYFGILFKSMTGMAVHEYLLGIRMQNAKRLLIDSTMSIEEIASEIGIGDVFYFTKLFKRHEGITPGKYRRMLNESL